MSQENKTELKKFLSPSMVGVYVGGVCIIIGIIGSFFATFPGGIILLFVMLAVFFSAKPLWQMFEVHSFFSEATEKGTLSEVYRDYVQGTPLLGGNIRLGEKYVVGFGCVTPTKYEDMVQVYEYIHKTNGAVDSHQVKAKLENGDTRILCRLHPGRVDQLALLAVFAGIKDKNEKVKIGV